MLIASGSDATSVCLELDSDSISQLVIDSEKTCICVYKYTCIYVL